jgi:hypothetical protein
MLESNNCSFYLEGGKQKMKIRYEDEIFQSPDKIFPWIADPEKAMKWQKDVKEGTIITNNPEVIGTTFKETIEESGNTLEMYGTITKYKHDTMIGFHIKSKIHKFDVDYILEETGETTKIFIDVLIIWKFPMNIICLFTGKKIEAKMKKQLQSEVSDLKSLCIGK